jgi:beta-mannosidase
MASHFTDASYSYVYYTQVMQAETLASAYRLWRRNWCGPGREYTAGALVWQVSLTPSIDLLFLSPSLAKINDCWPVTSWAIVDYFLRPKPAYFAIARELRLFTVGMTRKESQTFDNDKTAAFFKIETLIEIWGTNNTLKEMKAKLELIAFDLHSDWTESWSKSVILAPNSSTELYKGEAPGLPIRTKKSEVPRTIILSARLLGDSGEVLGRYSNWCECNFHLMTSRALDLTPVFRNQA